MLTVPMHMQIFTTTKNINQIASKLQQIRYNISPNKHHECDFLCFLLKLILTTGNIWCYPKPFNVARLAKSSVFLRRQGASWPPLLGQPTASLRVVASGLHDM